MKKVLLSLALIALFATPVLADGGSIAGSYVELVGPPEGVIGETVVVEMLAYNASVDAEWIADFIITWPGCVDVLDGWYVYEGTNTGFILDFEAVESQARFTDGDGGYGELYGDEFVTLFVELTLTEDCVPTTQIINYHLYGDIWGDEPHEVEGTFEWPVTGGVANDNSTWTTVKAMYR